MLLYIFSLNKNYIMKYNIKNTYEKQTYHQLESYLNFVKNNSSKLSFDDCENFKSNFSDEKFA